VGTKTDWVQLSQEALEDRRKGKRIKLQFDLEVVGADPDGRAYSVEARTLDVSEVGCSFEVARTLFPGEDVSLRVKRKNERATPQGADAVVFHIMWVKKEKDVYVVGAEMNIPGDPWKIAFPPKVSPVKPS
jgi:hypothetical protein